MKAKLNIILTGISACLLITALALKAEPYVELGICLAAYLAAGWSVLLTAAKNILRGRIFDENFLMALASIGAFIIGEYPEAAAVMLFYQVGELFQSYAVNRSRKSISSLMDIRPDFAYALIGGEKVRRDPFDIGVGDIIMVSAGERVPLDGKVITGEANLDTSALTGESAPRFCAAGDEALSGCICTDGTLNIEVTKPYSESTASKILELVENASARKSKNEQFITRFAKYYTPFVVAAALVLAVVPPLLNQGSFSQWIYRALVFLVVSCPCALVISVPLGYFGGIGRASKHGILVKGGNYLDALTKVDTVVFDKTGTLTKGTFKLSGIFPSGGISKEELLEYAAYAECNSSHPIAKSVLAGYGKKPELSRISSLCETAGYGISCELDGKPLLAGNPRLMKKYGIACEDTGEAGTAVHIAYGNVYSGYLTIKDELKEGAAEAVSRLRKSGVKNVLMLSGDRKNVAGEIAAEAGLDGFISDLLPGDKVAELEKILSKNEGKGKTAYVGDGINDAPVLARADIGIAMGALGSDAAIEAADIVLMNDSLYSLPEGIKIAKKTKNIVTQNIVFALAVKAAVLILSAFGIATMWEAVFADVGVSVIAILNSVRILRKSPGSKGTISQA